ncbi:unnamed protein product [Rotaria socialis]|uniref:Uncharacterized protein n=1 Tax=Rotaria socialis TaxID=392032 RepID=A0A818LLX0_9BILA|nr:unnamed protein product [Rotaria socialis]
MRRTIRDLLEPHCDVLIKDGNSKCVSSVVKKRLYKMQDQVHRSSHPTMNGTRPMAILFFFMDGYVDTVQIHRQAKRAMKSPSITSASHSLIASPLDQFQQLTVNDRPISPTDYTKSVSSPISVTHSPFNAFLGFSMPPNHDAAVVSTRNHPTTQLCFSDYSICSNEEEEPQWLCLLREKQEKMLASWEKRMEKRREDMIQRWENKVKKQREELTEKFQEQINEQMRLNLIKNKGKKSPTNGKKAIKRIIK